MVLFGIPKGLLDMNMRGPRTFRDVEFEGSAASLWSSILSRMGGPLRGCQSTHGSGRDESPHPRRTVRARPGAEIAKARAPLHRLVTSCGKGTSRKGGPSKEGTSGAAERILFSRRSAGGGPHRSHAKACDCQRLRESGVAGRVDEIFDGARPVRAASRRLQPRGDRTARQEVSESRSGWGEAPVARKRGGREPEREPSAKADSLTNGP
jgi:hypothetical protein